MMGSNRNLLFQESIFRFHVCFGGCIGNFPCQKSFGRGSQGVSPKISPGVWTSCFGNKILGEYHRTLITWLVLESEGCVKRVPSGQRISMSPLPRWSIFSWEHGIWKPTQVFMTFYDKSMNHPKVPPEIRGSYCLIQGHALHQRALLV